MLLFEKLIEPNVTIAAPPEVLISVLILTSSMLSLIKIELTGPLSLGFFLFPVLKLEKYLLLPLT